MIDAGKDNLLTLSAAAKRIPSRVGGKRVHVATVYRWAERGVRGIQLETIRLGGTRYTTEQAIREFSEALSEAPVTASVRSRRKTPVGRAAQIEQANKRCEAAGI